MKLNSNMMVNIHNTVNFIQEMAKNHISIGEGGVHFLRPADFLDNFSLDETTIFDWGCGNNSPYKHQIVAVVEGVTFFSLLTDNDAEEIQKYKDAE